MQTRNDEDVKRPAFAEEVRRRPVEKVPVPEQRRIQDTGSRRIEIFGERVYEVSPKLIRSTQRQKHVFIVYVLYQQQTLYASRRIDSLLVENVLTRNHTGILVSIFANERHRDAYDRSVTYVQPLMIGKSFWRGCRRKEPHLSRNRDRLRTALNGSGVELKSESAGCRFRLTRKNSFQNDGFSGNEHVRIVQISHSRLGRWSMRCVKA